MLLSAQMYLDMFNDGIDTVDLIAVSVSIVLVQLIAQVNEKLKIKHIINILGALNLVVLWLMIFVENIRLGE